jgi:hypothetical protein
VFCQPEARQKYIIRQVTPTDIHRFFLQSEYPSRLIIVTALWMEQNSKYFVMSMPRRTDRLFTIWVNSKSLYPVLV